ncbi:restriction endonuclease subunit S [Staphylococcus caprae]|uniref:restriction endonuclease subunit S n=1 Tax=Staphylococcus caprae TaxID=29380 RepID=UPI003B227265
MTEHQNTPELRFTEFQGEWELKKLGDIVTFSKGKSLSKKDLSDSGEPCILYGELYTKYGSILKNVFSKTNIEDKNLVKSKRNQVLVPSSGETAIDIATATCIETDENIIIGGDLNILTPQSVDGRFISFYINGKGKYNLAKYAQGKTVVHLYNSDLKHLNLNLPKDFEEQSKISNFFSKLDRQIELEEQKLKLLKEQKKGYVQKIFSQELRFKDKNENDYTKWETKKIKELGNVYTGNTPSKKQSEYWDSKNYIWVTPTDIKDTKNLKSSEYMLSNEGFKKARQLPKNTLLITCIASIGKNAILREVGACNQQINALVPIDNNDVDFLYYAFEKVSKYMKRIAGKTATQIVNKSTFENIIVKVPNFEEQKKLSNFLNSLDKLIEKQSNKVRLLKQQKQGLLQKMFV